MKLAAFVFLVFVLTLVLASAIFGGNQVSYDQVVDRVVERAGRPKPGGVNLAKGDGPPST